MDEGRVAEGRSGGWHSEAKAMGVDISPAVRSAVSMPFVFVYLGFSSSFCYPVHIPLSAFP